MKKYLFFSIACLLFAIIAGFLATVLIWGDIALDGILCGIACVIAIFASKEFFLDYLTTRKTRDII